MSLHELFVYFRYFKRQNNFQTRLLSVIAGKGIDYFYMISTRRQFCLLCHKVVNARTCSFQKLKELRGWEDGQELRQAQMIINHMWTCLLRGNRKYRTNQLQMHVSSNSRLYQKGRQSNSLIPFSVSIFLSILIKYCQFLIEHISNEHLGPVLDVVDLC